MKKTDIFFVIAASAFFALAFSSCVNEEYDIEDINTEVTLGSGGLSLPLGSTKQLTLDKLLSSMDEDMLQVIDGGAYALRIKDTLNLGDRLPDMDVLDIPDVVFEQETLFSLSGIDEESLSIEGQEFEYDFELAEDGIVPDVELPVIFIEHKDPTGIWKYGKEASEMTIDMDDVHVLTGELFSLPEGLSNAGGAEIAVGDLPEAVVNPVTVDVKVKAECPEGISNISDITMSETSMLTVKLSLENSFISKGSLIPDMVLDLGGLMTVGEGLEQIQVAEDFVLDEDNSFVASRSYRIDKVNVTADDWNDLLLEMKKTLEVSGTAALKEAMTNAELIAGVNEGMRLRVDVEFSDLLIESMMMDVQTDPVEETMDIPVTVAEISLPEGVESIDKVIFKDDSCMDIIIKLENIADINGLQTTLKTLVMTFPEEMTVREAVDGKVVLEDVDLSKGMDHKIHIDEIKLPAPADGKIAYEAHVLVEAEMVAGGRICSADVPVTEEEDGCFIVDAESHFEIEDYIVNTSGMENELEMEPQEFEYILPDGISDIGTFSVIPEGSPVLTVDLSLPQTALAVEAGEAGLKMAFPEFLRFKDVDDSYGFDPQTNTITLSGELPEQILLPIDKVTVAPALNEETGKYYAGGEIKVEGSIAIASGEVSGKDVEQIASSSAKVSAHVPEIVADEILFEHFEVGMDESFDFTILKPGDLPEEVKKVSRVDLADVKAVIDVTVDNLPDLGTEPSVNLIITMPKELVLDPSDARVEGNAVKVTGKIDEGRIEIAPVGIQAIDLSGYDVNSEDGLVGHVTIDGAIEAEDPELDLASLDGDIKIALSAAIEDIVIEKITANVAYDIDGVNEKMALEGLPDFMKGEDFVLDLANPHLVLKAKTNIGIPVKGDLLINPVVNGQINEEGQIKASIALPSSQSCDEIKEVVFWLGGDEKACPSDYTFIQADINKLIRRVPDQLELSLVAGTDADHECVIEPSADYVLDIEYDFVVPFEFGEDLHIEISDTLDGLDDIVGQLLEKNRIQLGGSITSSLPLALEMKIDMLDINDDVIPVEQDAVQAISPCNSDGSPTETPLDLTLAVKKGVSAAGLSSLKLTFTVTSPNYTGIPVDEQDFVQAKLTLALPEGITLDIADLNSDEK